MADALVLLAEEGIKPDGGKAQWGDEGYYFVEAEEFVCSIPRSLLTLLAANFDIEMG